MDGLLIANKDQTARNEMAELFRGEAYRIVTTDSVANALAGILDKSVQVVLLGGAFDEQFVAQFVPLLKKCNRNLSIILVTEEMPLELLRRIRQEGIFYHALKPTEHESWDEIRQAVACAFKNYHAQQGVGQNAPGKGHVSGGARALLTSLALMLAFVPHALATDTGKIYNSGILVLLFVGFCALLIVAQLLPVLLALFGLTKGAARRVHGGKQVAEVNSI